MSLSPTREAPFSPRARLPDRPLLSMIDLPVSPSPPSSPPLMQQHPQNIDTKPHRTSWVDINSDSDDHDLDYLRARPSPFSPGSHARPRAPTPSASASAVDDSLWSPRVDTKYPTRSPFSSYIANSVQPSTLSRPAAHSHLLRSVSEGESSFLMDSPNSHSFARPTKSMPLPDPSHFPDPYPFRPPHHHLTSTLPALSSAGSSSASTRSSAYTSSGSALASGDYGHVHVVSGEDESNVGVGITSDDVVQLLESDNQASSASLGLHSRAPIDQTRWSESYSGSVRSRSSSVGNGSVYENTGPKLREKPSYDMGWQTVDERDEVGVSEEETDEDHVLVEDDEEEKEEERTSAVVIAEEGRGLIVHGDGLAIVQLQVHPGTTHLLVGSSSTPNGMPAFLTSTIPQICVTLLALDISANFLGALPPCLAGCASLEELNVASNPLRVLPDFISDLTSLRVLIADSTGIATLPDTLGDLNKLHTLSIRRNKMHTLPSWLSVLSSLQTLYVDGNPFQGPWKALVEPLLVKTPVAPINPSSTLMFSSLPSASVNGSVVGTEPDDTDLEDLEEPTSADPFPSVRSSSVPEEEDQTVIPANQPFPVSAPLSGTFGSTRLTRTRTTPNHHSHNKIRINGNSVIETPSNSFATQFTHQDSGYLGDREIRRMKSAGELRRGLGARSMTLSELPRNASSRLLHPASASSSNLLSLGSSAVERSNSKRFASLGASSGLSNASRDTSRTALTQSLWGSASESGHITNAPGGNPTFASPPTDESQPDRQLKDGEGTIRARPQKEGKEKSSRWGFFKKMSMGKIRIDSPSRSTPKSRTQSISRPQTSAGFLSSASAGFRTSTTPQIDVRFSTTGTLGALSNASTPAAAPSAPGAVVTLSPAKLEKKKSTDVINIPSPGLLTPPAPSPKATKRRSFLPLETPPSLNIPIPNPSAFVSGVTASNGPDDLDDTKQSPSPVSEPPEQNARRDEERTQESYMRALRSVMAYLKDMNDLGLSQQPNSMSMYGASTDDAPIARSRRPTESGREASMAISNPITLSSADPSEHLRPMESITSLRNGTSNHTLSVATTDSNGSSDERKFKDDKGKRAMVVREIVETERTYVKGLEELVDLYIKPSSVAVNLLTGVGSSRDTVVPSSERKIVFSGVEALFSFHHGSFLPALEIAAAPMMQPSAVLQEADADGQLSSSVAKAVGNVFLKHAAFLKMYSSYINNFDNSVQRVKHWVSDRSGTSSPGSALSPSSSTVQLAGFGLAMSAVSTPTLASDGSVSSGLPTLTSGQRKRIKTYLKRCRMNPRHSQLNLEGYLLLPVQRIPRYRLLLEELLRSTPPTYEYMDDPLDRALTEISSLANNMNEGKRESESRRKLVQWQSRIRGKFPSPLVQPHRRLIMDGPLLLTRVVRKTTMSFEAINAQGDASTVQVECLAPELNPRSLVGILCNDLLVLCRDPTEGQDPSSYVDLWAVLRMQTLPQPASIIHGNALRLVDNKAILYFDTPSPSDALNWFRAINLHIPASKT